MPLLTQVAPEASKVSLIPQIGTCSECNKPKSIHHVYTLPKSGKVTSQFCKPCFHALVDQEAG